MAETCKGCRFFIRDGDLKDSENGKCRRYPRVVVVKPSVGFAGMPGSVSVEQHYPTHRINDWCGEFQKEAQHAEAT